MSWDRRIRIINVADASTDGFTKDVSDIVASATLNSEGFITGDANGSLRAWIIGFTDTVVIPAVNDDSVSPRKGTKSTQPQASVSSVAALEVICEENLSEISEDLFNSIHSQTVPEHFQGTNDHPGKGAAVAAAEG